MIGIPVLNSDSNITTSGKWKAVLGTDTVDLSQFVDVPYASRKTFSIPLTGVTLTTWTEKDVPAKELNVFFSFDPADAESGKEFQPVQSTINPEIIIIAALTITGLGVGALFLKRLEKVVDSPVVEIGLIVAVGVGLVFLFRYFQKL